MQSNTQNRIILWGHARSTSTAFYRAMISASDTKGIFEPYQLAYYFGSDRVSSQFLEREPLLEYSFANMKALCEKEYKDYKTVFVKDMGFSLRGKLHDLSALPEKYIHTFIIRNPEKAVLSYYRMCSDTTSTGLKFYQPIGTKEQYCLFQLVTQTLGQKSIVIDSDDLLNDPEDILKKFCKEVGIAFEDSMLHWKDMSEEDIKPQKLGFFSNALAHKGFVALNQPEADQRRVEVRDLPQEALRDIEQSKRIYNKMKAFKIQPKNP